MTARPDGFGVERRDEFDVDELAEGDRRVVESVVVEPVVIEPVVVEPVVVEPAVVEPTVVEPNGEDAVERLPEL